VDHGAGLDDVEKRKCLTLQGLELLTLGRPARSKSLYRQRSISVAEIFSFTVASAVEALETVASATSVVLTRRFLMHGRYRMLCLNVAPRAT
jgi:hypothetical protein